MQLQDPAPLIMDPPVITVAERESLRLAISFALSELVRALDDGEFQDQEMMVAVARIRDYNKLLEVF